MKMLRYGLSWCVSLGVAVCTSGMPMGMAASVQDQEEAWRWYGANTFRMDDYNAYGDRASSPYPLTGVHYFDELNLGFEYRMSPYDHIFGEVGGLLYNGSGYRNPNRGLVVERWHVLRENGDARVPYRVDAGDFFAFQSYRTIQRSLKGVLVEWQPVTEELRNSIVMFSGGGSPAWQGFQLKDDWSSGISWLVEHAQEGRLSANLVVDFRQASPASGLPALRQQVASVAFEKSTSFLAQQVTIEGEAARFIGDYAGVNGANAGLNRQGNGYFIQIAGVPVNTPAFSYRLRWEGYDQDFRPAGSSVQADRRSMEGYASWRRFNGMTLSLRTQYYRTGWKTNNPLDVRVYGINISGPWVRGVSGTVEAFVQSSKTANLSTNTQTRSLNVNLNKGFGGGVSGRAGYFHVSVRNLANIAAGLSVTRQYSLGLSYRFEHNGFSGSVSPGLVYRLMQTTGVPTMKDLNPTVSLQGRRGPHSVSFSYSILDQNRPLTNGGVVTRTAGINYGYRYQNYTFGIEGGWYERNPDAQALARTDAWRVGAFLTISFERSARHPVGRAMGVTEAEAFPVAGAEADITALQPGMKLREALRYMHDAGLGDPVERNGLLIWFVRVLRDVDQPQRIVLETDGTSVLRSALLIDFDDMGDGNGKRQIFDRVRREVLDRYGRPDAFLERGNFDTALAVRLGTGQFVRTMEWRRGDGVLRFGIPRRMDGQVRMELQFALEFPDLADTSWGMEEVQ